MSSTDIAIIDHGLGNLFSVKQACDYAGMDATITRDHEEIRAANGIILPGVGAFSRAMDSLSELQLDDVIQDVVDSGKPLVGICLGAQLILSETEEFGTHTGLDLIPGEVRRLDTSIDVGDNKVPYGASKVAVEHYMRVYNEVYGLAIFSLRYFNLYGIECGQTWQ